MKAITLILPLMALLGLFACEKQAPSPESTAPSVPETMRPTVSFYHIPKCFLCLEIASSLNELEQLYRRQLNFRTVDYHFAASQEILQRFQLGSHGLLITDPQGGEIWKYKAHEGDHAMIARAIEAVAQGKQPASGN